MSNPLELPNVKVYDCVLVLETKKQLGADNGGRARKTPRKTPKRTNQLRQKVFATLMMLDDAVNVCLSFL